MDFTENLASNFPSLHSSHLVSTQQLLVEVHQWLPTTDPLRASPLSPVPSSFRVPFVGTILNNINTTSMLAQSPSSSATLATQKCSGSGSRGHCWTYHLSYLVGKRRENVSSILKTMDKVYNLDWFINFSKKECSAAGFK